MTQKQRSQNLIQRSPEIKGNSPKVSIHSFDEADVPLSIEKPHSDWILYGVDNLYPQELILAWQQSATHNALTNGISQLIAGEDIVPVEGTDIKVALDFEIFSNNVNTDSETLKDIISKTAFDLYLQGYFAWEVIWNNARTKIQIRHVPAETVRSGKMDPITGMVQDYYISPHWSEYAKKKFKPIRIPTFDKSNRSAAKQLMFSRQYRPSQYYYSTPDYIGAMNWILLDNRVSEFQLNNIENGFFPSTIIQFFNGEPPQGEKDAIENKFKQRFTGKAANKLVFVYNNSPDQALQFDTFEPANLDKRFKELMPEITEKIMVGHRVVSPMLFGIKDQSGWGNNAEEISTASILFNKQVILPYQLFILRHLQEVLKVNGMDISVQINTLQPDQFLSGTNDGDTAEVSMEDDRKIVPDEMVKPVIDHLKKVGEKQEDIEKNGWVLIKIGDELTEAGKKLKKKHPEKFQINNSTKDEPSSIDQGLFKFRYQYKGPRDDKNRNFCREVLGLNLIYRKEDIDKMSLEGANLEFGIYNIFTYKGSYGCRHKWNRLDFFKTGAVTGNQIIPEARKIPDSEVPGAFQPQDSQATNVNPKPNK